MVKNLKKVRLKNNITQEKLAEMVGISKQSIQRYESGKYEPDISTLIKLSIALNTTVDYLVGIEKDGVDSRIFIDGKPVTSSEILIITYFRKMSKKMQKMYEKLFHTMINENNKET